MLTPFPLTVFGTTLLIATLTVHIVLAIRARRRIPPLDALLRRHGRSDCGHVDTQIRDPKDVQREARAAVRDPHRPAEDRARAVHDLAHGRAATDTTRWTLRNTVQDRYLDEDHRFAMLTAYCRCDPEAALEALDLFARDGSNNAFRRLEAAQWITERSVRRRAVLAIATAAEVDAECRLKAATALKPLAPRDAEAAFQVIATDAAVGFGVRILAANEWALMDREAAVEALWRIVLATTTPWYWRIVAAAKLVMLRVRAAYDLLCEWIENPELPADARAQLSLTLKRLDA
ncbi:hypothetical protein [Glycomyces sp. NPDC047010]|uniref:hypothetical protein n=1 Tax=Glycomyces sp. NPDC047010 TaxID=3155023 RepID=UPI0033F43415